MNGVHLPPSSSMVLELNNIPEKAIALPFGASQGNVDCDSFHFLLAGDDDPCSRPSVFNCV